MTNAFEYDIYIPLNDNKGRAFPMRVIEETKKRLVELFGGFTDFRHRNEGVWKVGGVAYRDEILILRVLTRDDKARPKLRKLKESLQQKLAQENILIIERRVAALT
jgi:hypothetical protein